MRIIVHETKTIDVFQQEFHHEFPFLKIEFFRADKLPRTVDKNKIPANKTFSSFKERHRPKRMSILPSLTVSELNRKFRSLYGLGALIFRKSGKVWLEIKITENWTLQEQNEQGKALSVEALF